MANQNHSREFRLQSIVLNIMFVSLICSSHKERLKIEKLIHFFKNLRNITTPAFCKTFPARLLGEGLLVSSVKMNRKISFLRKLHVTL